MLFHATPLISGIVKCDIFFKTSRRIYSSISTHLTERIKTLLGQYQDVELCPHCVKSAGFGLEFTHSNLNVYPYCVDRNGDIVDPHFIDINNLRDLKTFSVDFMPLFNGGMKMVSEIISSGSEIQQNDASETETPLFKAVKTLGMFLENKEFHEECLYNMVLEENSSYTELDITVLLANHLFVPLTAYDHGSHEYSIISSDIKNKVASCPCTESCNAEMAYGNTGFGSGYLWYGRSDIMLFPVGGGIMNVNMVKLKDHDDSFMKNEEEDYPQKTYRQLRMPLSVQQVTSQAITFSLYQNKYQSENMEVGSTTTLVPLIFASRHYFDMYFYDSENDVLLRNRGDPMPIFETAPYYADSFLPKFNLNSILRLWMLINHLLLLPKLGADQWETLKDTCGIKDQINTYQAYDLMKKVEGSLETGSLISAIQMKHVDKFQVDKLKSRSVNPFQRTSGYSA